MLAVASIVKRWVGLVISTDRRRIATGGEEDEVGKAFKKELERRQISSMDDLDDPARVGTSRRGGYTPPPPFARGAATDEVPPQLQRSRALNSEGLEGFLPRASELLKLGLSFFLAFGPFIVAVALAFTAIYAVSAQRCNSNAREIFDETTRSRPCVLLLGNVSQVFGESFVHGGRTASGVPTYDPTELLNEPTVDPMIPM